MVREPRFRLLFHGTKSRFDRFDPKFSKSGEGVGCFDGWYFVENLKGAYFHVESYLSSVQGTGLVYVCLVPNNRIIENCESGLTESGYHDQTSGVEYFHSDEITIIEVLPVDRLFDETVGSPKKHAIHDEKAPLRGGLLSFLRRED